VQPESTSTQEWSDFLPKSRHMASDDVTAAKSWIDNTSAAIASLTVKHAAYADVAVPAAAAIAMMRDGANVFINEMQVTAGAFEDATLTMLRFPWNCVTSDSTIQNVLKQKATDEQSNGSKLRCIVELLLAHTHRCCALRQEHARAGLITILPPHSLTILTPVSTPTSRHNYSTATPGLT
jgi:hypothetical protein